MHIIETGRGPIEYADAGSGEPLLYFHGTGITADVMVAVESRLIDDGFRLIVPHRPGYGRTPLSSHRSAVDCANVAAALLDSLGIRETSVMGSSGGAAFAASFAVTHAVRTRCLVLLCPQLHRWSGKRWLPATSRWTLPILRRPLLRRLLLRLYRISLSGMSVKQFLKTEAGDRYADVADDPDAQNLASLSLTAMARGTRCPGFENDFSVFLNEEILGTSESSIAPTLVIHDERDPVAPRDHVEWFISRVPQCERVSLHTAGHLIWVGPDAERVHETRVRFLMRHVAHAV